MKFQRNYRSDVEWLKENLAGIVKNAMDERATENGNTTTFVTEQVAAATAAAKRLNQGGTYHGMHWGASSSADTMAVCTLGTHLSILHVSRS